MTTLKEAVEKNKLKDFIKERTKEEKKGDKEKFDKAIKSYFANFVKSSKSIKSGQPQELNLYSNSAAYLARCFLET